MTKNGLISILVIFVSLSSFGQSEIHPQHLKLNEVELLDGPLKISQNLNLSVLLNYDQNRLLTPFIKDAGLEDLFSIPFSFLKISSQSSQKKRCYLLCCDLHS